MDTSLGLGKPGHHATGSFSTTRSCVEVIDHRHDLALAGVVVVVVVVVVVMVAVLMIVFVVMVLVMADNVARDRLLVQQLNLEVNCADAMTLDAICGDLVGAFNGQLAQGGPDRIQIDA
jgi:hypothetical protein